MNVLLLIFPFPVRYFAFSFRFTPVLPFVIIIFHLFILLLFLLLDRFSFYSKVLCVLASCNASRQKKFFKYRVAVLFHFLVSVLVFFYYCDDGNDDDDIKKRTQII